MQLRRLDPDPAEADTARGRAVAAAGGASPAERPYLFANMVASADGRATLAGKSGGLSNEADRELFHALREQVDAVLVGAGTLRAERYGAFVRDAERRARREAAGLAPNPIGCVVTRSMNLPDDIPLFEDAGSTIAVYTSADAEPPDVAARLEGHAAARGDAHDDHGARAPARRRRRALGPVRQGGPTILGALVSEGLVDELFLSLAPCLVGGHGLSVVEGPESARAGRARPRLGAGVRRRALPALPRETLK